MEKKILIIAGIIFLFLFTAISIPAIAEQEYGEKISNVKITAIGTFARCDVDEVVYGHIFIGFRNNRIVFNEYIEISASGIGLIIITNHFLHCVISE